MSLECLLSLKGSQPLSEVVGTMLDEGVGTLSVAAYKDQDGSEKQPVAAVVVIQGEDTAAYLDALDRCSRELDTDD
ncbi:hypothetical protein [Endozoicomonas lisbonensis]|uniref:ACT domain-containing protein n=1 Tax=Endozoicomonas lisbonensis TaxID=3120522 RepID=A0ABV2SQJ5_9GAMM